jgi:dodecin
VDKRARTITRAGKWVRISAMGTPPGSPVRKGLLMSDSVYSVSEIVGSSTESIDDAIKGAIGRASKTLHNLDWFEVSGIRGRIEENTRCTFQVTLKVGFRLDERPA